MVTYLGRNVRIVYLDDLIVLSTNSICTSASSLLASVTSVSGPKSNSRWPTFTVRFSKFLADFVPNRQRDCLRRELLDLLNFLKICISFSCSNSFNLVQTCPNFFKLVQIFSNLSKLVQTCQNLSKLV